MKTKPKAKRVKRQPTFDACYIPKTAAQMCRYELDRENDKDAYGAAQAKKIRP